MRFFVSFVEKASGGFNVLATTTTKTYGFSFGENVSIYIRTGDGTDGAIGDSTLVVQPILAILTFFCECKSLRPVQKL